HHQQGPVIDYVYPPLEDPECRLAPYVHIKQRPRKSTDSQQSSTQELVEFYEPVEQWSTLPFYALP
ncbi:hypothetical protein IWQ62_006492, partial [Dispira parvispora]